MEVPGARTLYLLSMVERLCYMDNKNNKNRIKVYLFCSVFFLNQFYGWARLNHWDGYMEYFHTELPYDILCL